MERTFFSTFRIISHKFQILCNNLIPIIQVNFPPLLILQKEEYNVENCITCIILFTDSSQS